MGRWLKLGCRWGVGDRSLCGDGWLRNSDESKTHTPQITCRKGEGKGEDRKGGGGRVVKCKTTWTRSGR